MRRMFIGKNLLFAGMIIAPLNKGFCSFTNDLQKGVDHGNPKKIEGILGRGKGFL